MNASCFIQEYRKVRKYCLVEIDQRLPNSEFVIVYGGMYQIVCTVLDTYRIFSTQNGKRIARYIKA